MLHRTSCVALSFYSTSICSLLLLIIWTPLTSSFLDYFVVNIHNIPNPLHHLYHYSPPSSIFCIYSYSFVIRNSTALDLVTLFVRLCSVQTFTSSYRTFSLIMVIGAYRLLLVSLESWRNIQSERTTGA